MKKRPERNNTGRLVFLAIAVSLTAAALITFSLIYIINYGTDIDTAPFTSAGTVSSETTAVSTSSAAAVTSAKEITVILSEDETTVPTAETSAVTETSETAGTTEETSSETAPPPETSDIPETTENTATEEETTSEAAAPVTETTVQTGTQETEAAAVSDSYDISFFANDLFIGDSIYTGLYLYDYFPQSQVFAKVGLNPQSARTAVINGNTAVSKASSMQPTRIFIMLGSNGLAYMSASGMTENMKAFVGELQAASPGSAVYIVSIPPVTYEHELAGQETMSMVNSYNSLLEAASPECGAAYLDLCSRLQNDSGYFSSRYAEADGLHFLGAAYKRMLSYFQQAA